MMIQKRGNLPLDPSTDGKTAECVSEYSRDEMCAGLAHACICSDLEV